MLIPLMFRQLVKFTLIEYGEVLVMNIKVNGLRNMSLIWSLHPKILPNLRSMKEIQFNLNLQQQN